MTSTTTDTIPTFDFAALPMAQDRGEGWKALRDVGRVAISDGSYYLSHREDVEFGLHNPQIFSSAEAFDTLGSPIPLLPIAFDAPEHTAHRKLLNPFFNPKVIAEVLPSLQSQIDELIQVIADKPADAITEVMGELAIPYPSQVFLTFFGLPLEDRNQLIAWKDAVIDLGNPAVKAGPDALEPAFELINYLHEKIEDKRANPANDVLSELVTGPDALDQSEAMGLC
ncbi:MAG: cytochrome, partial [Aeromicrobium sp.]|nr:cytochrome [Aeromicrobium sp.]